MSRKKDEPAVAVFRKILAGLDKETKQKYMNQYRDLLRAIAVAKEKQKTENLLLALSDAEFAKIAEARKAKKNSLQQKQKKDKNEKK